MKPEELEIGEWYYTYSFLDKEMKYPLEYKFIEYDEKLNSYMFRNEYDPRDVPFSEEDLKCLSILPELNY